MKTRKGYWYLLIVVAAAAGGAYYWTSSKTAEKITYRWEKIDRGDVSISVTATGTLNAVTTVQVGSQVSGTIAKLYADFNSVVKEGALLAQLDPTFLQATVNEQKANVDRARAQVNETQRNVNRSKQLIEKSMIPQSEVDAATTSLESAQASLKQAEAALDRAQVNLHYATITAPISGVVISREVDVGQTVAASLQAPRLFTIANDLSKMQVQASVDEADIGSIKAGQEVSFRVDAYPEDRFTGTVSQIRLAPIITQNVVTYSVIIDVANPELKLMPGMTATVSIEVTSRDSVLRVPLMALKFTPPEQNNKSNGSSPQAVSPVGMQPMPGGKPTGERPKRNNNSGRVWTIENGQLKPLAVTRGIQNTRYCEIVESTLNEGDSVIVGTTGGPTQSTQTTNPFMPRMPGGGGGGGRRGM